MLDEFAPHIQDDALARYETDLSILRRGVAGIDGVYREQNVPKGRFPGLDAYRLDSAAIDARATALLDRVTSSRRDYKRVAAIGGFDRIPFLIVASGIIAMYGGSVLLAGSRSRARYVVALLVFASAALAIYPFASNLDTGARAGHRLLHSLAPMMTSTAVRQLQEDFVVIVHADGELETSFRAVPRSGRTAADLDEMVTKWPMVSSDLASLVGSVNDNIANFNALNDLESFTRGVGVSGLEAFPWLLVGIGVVMAALSVAALPRRKRTTR
jgi:hypothetical protein